MGGTYRGMCGGWVEHTEECMEDGWNIQRNVWRMGRTYRGMCGGWVEHTEECMEDGSSIQRKGGTYRGWVKHREEWVEGGGQYLTRRFIECSVTMDVDQGQLLQLTVTVILAFSVEPVSLPEACDT